MTSYQIQITDRLAQSVIRHSFLEEVVCRVLSEEQIDRASISIAIVDDAQIHAVNREFLGHDYPTDVISFLLSSEDGTTSKSIDTPQSISDESVPASDEVVLGQAIEGEIVVSVETAAREAGVHGWSPEAELLLYVVHGLLHLCGYDDLTDDARPLMRSREREMLGLWGFCPTGLES